MSILGVVVVMYVLGFFAAAAVFVYRDITDLVRREQELDELWDEPSTDTGAGALLLTGAATTTGASTFIDRVRQYAPDGNGEWWRRDENGNWMCETAWLSR